MRIYGPTSPRTFPTDRNPSQVVAAGASTVAGNTTTIQATYTVPAARRALITAQAFGNVQTVLAAGQTAQIWIRVQKAGAGAHFQVGEDDFPTASALGVRAMVAPYYLQLGAGDVLDVTVNVGVGAGAITGGGGFDGVEYDA